MLYRFCVKGSEAASSSDCGHRTQLGGSWLVISGVLSRVIVLITHIRGLVTALFRTHEPPRTLRCPVCTRQGLKLEVSGAASAFTLASWRCQLPSPSLQVSGNSFREMLLVLGGSWLVTSGVISPLIWVISTVTLLRTPLITSHEPPSTPGSRGALRARWQPTPLLSSQHTSRSNFPRSGSRLR